MAIDAHSTTAPAVQPGLLRTWAGAVPVPTPALTPALTAETVAMLAEVSAEIGENSDLAAAAQVFSDSGNNPEDVRHGGAGDAAQARHMRRALEGAIAHGIATLDALDAPDVDLEDEGEAEPSLGWIDGKPTLSDSHDDREAEDEREPDDEGDPLDRGELDGWRRPRRARVPRTEYAPAMAEREVRRLIVSPNVVPLFGGHRHG